MTIKEQILKLRSEGKTYKEIADSIPCTQSTVWYHCSNGAKQKHKTTKREHLRAFQKEIKTFFGGKCEICGYSKCLDALEFHHKDASKKENTVARLIQCWSKTKAYEEAKKCLLLCANCHRELHANEKIISPPLDT